MIYRIVIYIVGIFLLFTPPVAFSSDPVPIDVLYMDHGPMQPTLRELRALFPKYGAKIMVSWYDFESNAGEHFKVKKGINHHSPLIIWVAGRSEMAINGRTLRLEGFPTGSGPSFFQGKWKLEDLTAILDQVTGRN